MRTAAAASTAAAAAAPPPVLGRVEAWLTAALMLWLLVGPRIDLPDTPGARVEDLVFVALAVICVRHLRRGRPSGITLAVAGVVGTGLLSTLITSALGTVSPVTAVLYAVRPAEYWIVFPAALLLLRSARGAWTRRIDVLLAVVTVLQTGFAVLQYYFQIPIGFSHAAYTRAAGLTVGPYELGAIGAALVVYWVANGRWVLASIAVIGLASSIARVSVLAAALALAVLAVAWIVRQLRRVRADGWHDAFRVPPAARPRAAVQVLAVAASGFVLAVTLGIVKLPEVAPPPADDPVAVAPAEPEAAPTPTDSGTPTPTETPDPTPTPTETPEPEAGAPIRPVVPEESIASRLESTSVLGSWDSAALLADAAPRVRTASEYQDVAYAHLNDYVNATNAAQLGAEPSNLVRFFRWHLILRTIDDPVDVAIGLGPSFVGPSVDGSYLRFFADGGVLGVLAWLALIVMWLRRSPLWMRAVTLTYLVGGLFIDILYAQRPMVLLWLLLALAAARVEQARAAASDRPAAPAAAG